MYGNYYGGYMPQMQPMPSLNNAVNQCYQQIQSIPTSMQSQPAGGKILVLNETEAASYLVAPNNSVILWDKNLPIIYVKSVDANGVPSMQVLEYTVRVTNDGQTSSPHKCNCGDKFVTIEKFNELKAQFDLLLANIQGKSNQEVNENE